MSYLNDWWRVFFGGMEYPYTDSCKYNDDWLLMVVEKLVEEFANFVNLNKIKYADPIGWDITRQYEANTVVVDNRTGNAYISSKPVPAGVQINNTDYWTEIYNYANVIDTLREQIALNEGDRTTASQPLTTGQLVFISGKLYEVISDMIAGDSFVLNSNIKSTTIAEKLKELFDSNASLAEDLENETDARIEADDEIRESIAGLISGNTGYNVVDSMPAEPDNNNLYEDVKSEVVADIPEIVTISESELQAINRISVDTPNNTFELITFNIRNADNIYHNLLNGFEKINNTKKAMMLLGADIICLQEFAHGELFPSSLYRSKLMCNDYSPIEFALQPIMWENPVTFSHQNIISSEYIPFTQYYNEKRGIAKTTYSINNKTVVVYNVHMEAVGGAIQDAEYAELFTLFNSDNTSYKIIAGDLNVDLSTYSGLNQFINAGYKVLNRGEYPTYPSSGLAVDGIITSANISALELGTVTNRFTESLNSDHLPFRARLQLN